MCECLCGEVRGEFVFTPKDSKSTVCVDVYPGCRECEQIIGVDIRLFNEQGVEDFLDGRKGDSVEGDEYGHVPTLKSIPIISVQAMQETSTDLPDVFEYASVSEWLDDCGLDWLQAAMRWQAEQVRAGVK